jgi:hypothetical protein
LSAAGARPASATDLALAAVLEQGWGLQVSRSGLCQAFQRVAQKAEPT